MQHLNKIPVPNSVKEKLKNNKRVMNPLLRDKKHLIVDYMREVNMIDESVPYEKPSKYKFNLVSR